MICEYDALPEIGHACGHNLIAEAGIAAGLGVKAFIESQGEGFQGTVTVMGTPAEESVGGKVTLIQRGAFKDIDIAVMAHPMPLEIAMPKFICISTVEVTFKGKAAHAAAFPWEGVNALDAAVLAYTGISALRQQMKPTWRVHSIFTDGGVKPNIIPEKASLLIYVRSETMPELMTLKAKVLSCCSGAAQATGCSHEFEEVEHTCEDIQSNEVLAARYKEHMHSLGVTDVEWTGDCPGSTDMGNVSHVVPSIHPVYKITNGIGNHTREFAKVSNTQSAHEKTQTVAKALSLTCIDVLTGKDVLQKVRENFK